MKEKEKITTVEKKEETTNPKKTSALVIDWLGNVGEMGTLQVKVEELDTFSVLTILTEVVCHIGKENGHSSFESLMAFISFLNDKMRELISKGEVDPATMMMMLLNEVDDTTDEKEDPDKFQSVDKLIDDINENLV